MRGKFGARPHVIEPPPAIIHFPILGTIAPPAEIAVRIADKLTSQIDPAMGLFEPLERVDFNADGGVDFSDFILFAVGFSNADLAYDLDDDGGVGFTDFLEFVRAYVSYQ